MPYDYVRIKRVCFFKCPHLKRVWTILLSFTNLQMHHLNNLCLNNIWQNENQKNIVFKSSVCKNKDNILFIIISL